MSVTINTAPRGKVTVVGRTITVQADGGSTVTISRLGSQGIPGPPGGGMASVWGPIVYGSTPPIFIQTESGNLILAEYI